MTASFLKISTFQQFPTLTLLHRHTTPYSKSLPKAYPCASSAFPRGGSSLRLFLLLPPLLSLGPAAPPRPPQVRLRRRPCASPSPASLAGNRSPLASVDEIPTKGSSRAAQGNTRPYAANTCLYARISAFISVQRSASRSVVSVRGSVFEVSGVPWCFQGVHC